MMPKKEICIRFSGASTESDTSDTTAHRLKVLHVPLQQYEYRPRYAHTGRGSICGIYAILCRTRQAEGFSTLIEEVASCSAAETWLASYVSFILQLHTVL